MTNQEVEEIKGHFDKVAQGLRAEFHGEFAAVRTEAAATAQDLHREIGAVREDLRGEIAAVREDLRGEISTVREGLLGEIGAVREDLRGEIGAVRESLSEFRLDAAAVADHLKAEIAEVRHYTGAVAEDLRTDIRYVAEGVALANQRIDQVGKRVEALTIELRSGFADVRAEIHHLHETDDELRRRIEAQEQRGA